LPLLKRIPFVAVKAFIAISCNVLIGRIDCNYVLRCAAEKGHIEVVLKLLECEAVLKAGLPQGLIEELEEMLQ